MKLPNSPLYITTIYLVLSILWIALSDSAVLLLPDSMHASLQLIKGWFFVCASGALIYWLLRSQHQKIGSAINELEQRKTESDFLFSKNASMLEALPVAIVDVDFSEIKKYLDQVMQTYEGDLAEWFNETPQAMDTLIEKASFISVDGAACQLFKTDSPDYLAAEFQRTLTPHSLNSIKGDIIHFYSGQPTIKSETELACFDGSIFQASTFASLAQGAETTWHRLVVVIEDISEKSAAVKAVNSFFDLGVNLHVIAGVDGTVYRANQGWMTSLGYQASDLEGGSFLELVHPDDIDKTFNEISSLKEGVTTFFFENRFRASDGEYHLLTWSAISPTDSGLIYAVATDISKQRQAEEKLHQAAAIIENTSEGTMVTDLEGIIDNVNPAFTDITGYSSDEIIGQKASVLSSGHHDQDFYRQMWESLIDQGQWRGEIWNRNRAGEIFPEYLTINTLNDNSGVPKGYVGVFTDLSAIKRTEDTIVRLSTQDPLTGLPNAAVFNDRLQHSIEQSRRKKRQLAVLALDIDNFKLVNESLGFDEGDSLLVKVSDRIRASVRTEDTVARFGGDEFKILLEDIPGPAEISAVVEKLQAVFKEPFEQGNQFVHLTVCIGISLYPSDGQQYNVLIRNADTALSQAKQSGSNRYQYYAPELTQAALESMFIENALRVAIQQNQLFLLYQPQFDLVSHKLVGLEALIRWHHPDIGIVSPMKFIPVAERTGIINEIGEWVIETACRQGQQWLQSGYDFGRLAVNVSGVQLKQQEFHKTVSELLDVTGFDPDKLELEVTESFIMENPERAAGTLNKLRSKGIRTAIDDFGTGYSSLSYLKKLPIDKLKIDQSFVSELPENSDGFAIIDAIISLGKALNLTLIAEGVEQKAQEQSLNELGCDQVQGYLYSKPVNSEQIETEYLQPSRL